MEAVLQLMPEGDRVQYSAIGTLTIASTGKDATTGNLVTHEYNVEGPVMLFLTTTAIDLDEELLNRCVVLTVNESREQTQAIQTRQRFEETLEGLLAHQDKDRILTLHRNAQRLLRPLKVVNPYATHLTFLDDRTRTRRDHQKYLTLIRSIALLHQYQREVKTLNHNNDAVQYIEATLDDIELANTLAHEVLGRTLDELPPQTRRLLQLIHVMVTQACEQREINQRDIRFSRKAVRDTTGWGNTQIRIHLDRLVDMEYLVTHQGRRGQPFVYELLYQGEGNQGDAFLTGLIDIESLTMTTSSRGADPRLAGSKRPQNGPMAGSKRGSKNSATTPIEDANSDSSQTPTKRTSKEIKNTPGHSAGSEQTVLPLAAHASAK
jgi:uncharacterized protein YjiS (DUF1127 family)